jgi:hypothetical protein
MLPCKIYAINTGIGLWTALGFFRGTKSYDYEHKKREMRSSYNPHTYLYSYRFARGCIGAVVYICPMFLPWTVYKEIYRAEVVLRGLENEKDTYYFNDVI